MTDLFELPETEILCISLWQPWAQWVMLGWKTIETRTHDRFKNLVGKRIAIHASQKWDKHALLLARRFLSSEQVSQTHAMAPDSGKVLGTVFVRQFLRDLTTVHEKSALIECVTRRCGLFLEDPKRCAPFAITGRQGIFRVPVAMWTRKDNL